MIRWMQKLVRGLRERKRVREHIDRCGHMLHCPDCGAPLFAAKGAFVSGNDLLVYVYLCEVCGGAPMFTFDLAPVPLLVRFGGRKPGTTYKITKVRPCP